MGCASSNEPKEAKANGAAKPTGDKGEAGPEPAAPKQNPYLSLTPKDVFSLKMSWKGIRRCLEETGTSIFKLLFNAHPDYLTQYEKFKDIPIERLYSNTVFLDYVTSVMETMDIHVTELDDAEKTHQNIKKFGTDFKKLEIAVTIFNVIFI